MGERPVPCDPYLGRGARGIQLGIARRSVAGHKLRAFSAVTLTYVIARTALLFFDRCAVGDLEAQHADQLAVLGQHPNLPVACGVAGEVLLVGPGAVALATAMNIQRDAVDFFTVELPDVINALVQATGALIAV